MIEATTVSALARYLKDLLESNLTLTNLWVEGEISNLTRSQRGHVYFTLKDANAQIACVMFQRQYRGAPLESGAQVLAHGNVSFYEQRGNVQLIVDFVQDTVDPLTNPVFFIPTELLGTVRARLGG